MARDVQRLQSQLVRPGYGLLRRLKFAQEVPYVGKEHLGVWHLSHI